MRLPRLTARRAITLAAFLIMVGAAVTWATYTFGFGPRARALRFYDRITPGMTDTDVEMLEIDIDDRKHRGWPTTSAEFGDPGPTSCRVYVVFDPVSRVLLRKGVYLADDERPRWLAKAMGTTGIPYWNSRRRWP